MATTEDRLQGVDQLEELYRDSPDADPPPRLSLNDWCPRLLIGWIAVFGSIVLFEPVPTNPEAAVPAWGTVLVTVFTVALLATIVGLSLRRPWALRGSVLAGGLGIAIGAACVITDHHMGFWGAYEIVAFSGLAAASYIGTKTTA